MTFLPTTATSTNDDYPYGRLRCTIKFWLEFNPKKGFRFCSQTVNPKTGRINNPKKSTYSDIIIMGVDDNGYTKQRAYSFYELKNAPALATLLSENWHLFSDEQREYLYVKVAAFVKISIFGSVRWGGAELEPVKALWQPCIDAIGEAWKSPTENHWESIVFPTEEEENSLKDDEYKPFGK